jgi:hypothetical protein
MSSEPAAWSIRFATVASMLTWPGRRIAQGDRRKENGTMTPQQKALMAELRVADYPTTWKLNASAADDRLVANGTRIQTSERAGLPGERPAHPSTSTR